jgi:hypothetical protein
MTSEENPWSSHGLEERTCEYCGELFYAHHGLQRYCPEKFNRRDYCKNQQKKMASEAKLAEKASELAKLGMKVNPETPIDRNIGHLKAYMGNSSMKYITNLELDQMGYDITAFESKIHIVNTNRYQTKIGDFVFEWIKHENNLLTFKITRI